MGNREIKTRELFGEVTSKRVWYKQLGISRAQANVYKTRFRNGQLSEGKMYEILVKLGYEYLWKENASTS